MHRNQLEILIIPNSINFSIHNWRAGGTRRNSDYDSRGGWGRREEEEVLFPSMDHKAIVINYIKRFPGVFYT